LLPEGGVIIVIGGVAVVRVLVLVVETLSGVRGVPVAIVELAVVPSIGDTHSYCSTK